MNWAGLQTALAAQVLAIAGGAPVYWEPLQSNWQAWPRVLLSVLSGPRKVGKDETRYRYDEAADALLPRQYGPRALTVQIKVESRDQTLTASARAIAETIRTRLGRQEVLAALREVDLAVSSTTDVVTIDRLEVGGGRLMSVAVLELVLLTHVSDEQTADDVAGDYIATVEISETVPDVRDEVVTYLVGPQDP